MGVLNIVDQVRAAPRLHRGAVYLLGNLRSTALVFSAVRRRSAVVRGDVCSTSDVGGTSVPPQYLADAGCSGLGWVLGWIQ